MKSLEEIRRIKGVAEVDLLKLPGVVGVDIGHKLVGGVATEVMAIRVYVEKKKDVPQEHTIPVEIEGVPTDVIERKYIPHSS